MTKLISIAPVLNLRREPVPHSGTYEKDSLQETQLLYGEQVIVHAVKEDWLFVEAVEQYKFSQGKGWHGYQGWVEKKYFHKIETDYVPNVVVKSLSGDVFAELSTSSKLLFSLSFGTRLMRTAELGKWAIIRLPNGENGVIANAALNGGDLPLREGLIAFGKKMLGAPYLWGGRSAYRRAKGEEVITSVDCSGFVNLLYRTVFGRDLPRDAHDQYLVAEPKEYLELLVGDPIFLADKERPERVSHVMLFAGEDSLLEATMQTGTVRMTTGVEKLGKTLQSIQNHGHTEHFIVHYGSFANRVTDPSV